MNRDFQLGEWIVRARRDCIERGGTVVHIKPKSMAVLERLARVAGEVVTRNELFDAVWPGGAVTDDVLTQCIVELRKALGDPARNPHYIETIPKVGFRLLCPVTPLVPVDENPPISGNDPRKHPMQVTLLILSTVLMSLVLFWYLTGLRDVPESGALAEEQSLAVLPFVDISEKQDQAWYAYGLTEELINRLAQLEGLQVTSRTSSYHFQDRNKDLRKIGEALGVKHLLEGSVRADNDKLRITAQLIDTQNGFHAWSGQFDRPRADIFTVQEEIAEAVANALSIKLQVGDLGTMTGGTDSVEAYELFMLSKVYQWEATPDSMLQAINTVKRAIAIDPDYAWAWLHLSGLYVNTHSIRYHMDDTDWLALSRQALGHARELEPDLPKLKFLTMTIQYVNRQWSDVEETMDRGAGIELSSSFDLMYGWIGFLNRVGRIREGIPILQRMRKINPYSSGTASSLSHVYTIVGRLDEALAEAERAYTLDGFKARTTRAGVHAAMSANDSDLLRMWLARAEQHMPERVEFYAAMSQHLDDREAALGWLREVYQRTEDFDYPIQIWAAWYGDAELALNAMQRLPIPWVFWGNEMKEVRRMPGFKDRVRQVGLEEYFREYGWNDFCHPVGLEDFECI